MTDPRIYKEAIEIIERQVQTECEKAFLDFQDAMLFALSRLPDSPEGLEESLKTWTLDKKHLFFRGFKNKIILRIGEKLRRQDAPSQQTDKATTIERTEEKRHEKNRMFLEAYFVNDCNARKASEYLGIAKSTFHDWKHAHAELIEAEARKTFQQPNELEIALEDQGKLVRRLSEMFKDDTKKVPNEVS